jgi:hypothetical protein
MVDDDHTQLLTSALHELSHVRRQRAEELHEANRRLGEAIIHGNDYERIQVVEDYDHGHTSLQALDGLIFRIHSALGTADHAVDDSPF